MRASGALFVSIMLLVSAALLGAGCSDEGATSANGSDAAEQEFLTLGLETDTSKAAIDIENVLSGGPGKDDIPALTEPVFVSVGEAEVPNDEVRGILIEFDGDVRYYPYNIMVWHEIANDVVGGTHVAVTF